MRPAPWAWLAQPMSSRRGTASVSRGPVSGSRVALAVTADDGSGLTLAEQYRDYRRLAHHVGLALERG